MFGTSTWPLRLLYFVFPGTVCKCSTWACNSVPVYWTQGVSYDTINRNTSVQMLTLSLSKKFTRVQFGFALRNPPEITFGVQKFKVQRDPWNTRHVKTYSTWRSRLVSKNVIFTKSKKWDLVWYAHMMAHNSPSRDHARHNLFSKRQFCVPKQRMTKLYRAFWHFQDACSSS